MNNFVKTALILSVALFSTNADAGVRFLVDSPTHTHRDVLKGDAGTKIKRMCNNRGYTRTNCRQGEVALEYCPQDSSYFKYCCPEEFSSTKEECYDAGLEPSSRSCHGYYRCEATEETSEKGDYMSDEGYTNDYNEGYSESSYYEDERSYEEEGEWGREQRRRRVHPNIRTQQIR
ncbi:MAG: hypothetical protein IJZ59_06660 [Alphaproteobacteria bacterium]|nr:hypothetical protein [Alphaproteobacteria bacterium]